MTDTRWLSVVLKWLFAVLAIVMMVGAGAIVVVMVIDPSLPPGATTGMVDIRVLGQPGRAVGGERPERVSCGPGPHAGLAVTAQVGADGLAVPPEVAGDRRDRPPLTGKRVRVDVFLPCDHERRGSFELACGQRPPALKEPRPSQRSHAGGEFQ